MAFHEKWQQVRAAGSAQQVIVPRKGVLELQQLLAGDGNVDRQFPKWT